MAVSLAFCFRREARAGMGWLRKGEVKEGVGGWEVEVGV